jgi:SNF1-activating kinase 1
MSLWQSTASGILTDEVVHCEANQLSAAGIMTSDRACPVNAEFDEDADGGVTPFPISPDVDRASTTGQDEATTLASLPNQAIKWLGPSANGDILSRKDMNNMNNMNNELHADEVSMRRPGLTPASSYHHAPHNPDHFALHLHRTGSPPFARPPSRAASTQRSSSSIHTLAKLEESSSPHSLRKAASNLSNRSDSRVRLISHSKSSSTSFLSAKSLNSEQPIYPDQSFASLQTQFAAGRPPPVLRTRSSNSSPNRLYSDMSLSSRPQRTHQNLTPAPVTAGNTPMSSPGLFSPTFSRPPTSDPPGGELSHSGSPLLHPAHTQKPKVTHTAEIDRDLYTGNKYINDYEILGEIGRGEHGKVKLGRRIGEETNVAIKIVPRYSKRRRLGKLGAPEDETKREVAVLKKARHPNVVSLLEVIDDPGKNKVYLVLEFVEHGEIQWRKRAPFEILGINNTRMDAEKDGDTLSIEPTEAQLLAVAKAKRRREKLQERSLAAGLTHVPKWSLEHSADTDDESESTDLSNSISRQYSRSNIPSRTESHEEYGFALETQLSGSMYGAYDTHVYRNRAASVAASATSHMSSEFEFSFKEEDLDHYGYVPALTFEECRNAIKDTLLGLEFLHFIGIIHRDIKPMNLLVAANDHVKISDFGVSYLGRPVSDEEEDKTIEAEAETLDNPKELARSVGTPGFWAPELCYDVTDPAQVAIFEKDGTPKITQSIDLWSLGITLYGMVYARLPFYEVREPRMHLYEVISRSDPFIPRTRLVPVDTTNSEPVFSATGPINCNKRLDYELKFEVVPDTLRDFIKQLLTKDPDKRITIAGAKKHPWVLEGVADPSQWLKVVNPGHKKKSDILDVDEKEMSRAVVKRSIIERAVSGVTRMAGNLLGRRDTRKRARSATTSNSASSESIASPSASSTSTVGKGERSKEGQRASFRGDEVVAAVLKTLREGAEHPLAQSQTASPDGKESPLYFAEVSDTTVASGTKPSTEHNHQPMRPAAISSISTANSDKTIRASQYTKRSSVLDHPLQENHIETSNLLDAASTSLHGLFSGAQRGLAGMRSRERRQLNGSRSPSSTRASSDTDAHSEPIVAMSNTEAAGDFEVPEALRNNSSVQDRPRQHLSLITPNGDKRASHFQPPESSESDFEQAQAINRRRHLQEVQLEAEQAASRPESRTATDDCPPSPDDVMYLQKGKTVAHENSPTTDIATLPSASTIASSEDFDGSSVSQSASNPSIGAISGASSPPNDPFLAVKDQQTGHGSDNLPDFMRTSDTITAHGRPAVTVCIPLKPQVEYDEEDDEEGCDEGDDSSGDEGLVMTAGGSRRA